MVTASADKTARVWNAASGQLLVTLEGHTGPARDAAFSPDGQRIVTAGGDNTAGVWNATDGQLVAKLEGHTGPVLHAAFSPDGQTASGDNTAGIWSAANGQLVAPRPHELGLARGLLARRSAHRHRQRGQYRAGLPCGHAFRDRRATRKVKARRCAPFPPQSSVYSPTGDRALERGFHGGHSSAEILPVLIAHHRICLDRVSCRRPPLQRRHTANSLPGAHSRLIAGTAATVDHETSAGSPSTACAKKPSSPWAADTSK